MAALSLCGFTTSLRSFRPSPFPGTRVHPSLPFSITTRNLSSPMSSDTVSAETNTPSNDDVLVQYVVLRRDLIDTWPLGSVVTQGCHASVTAIWSHKDDAHTLQYCSPQNIDSMHKVTLEVKGETQILNLAEKLSAGGIDHKLWIEQPENIPTCLATKPYPKTVVSSFFKKLKLCK
ncbi:putative peptidyl-tRNA hydrolase PTRHD1 [Hibiscus syriacus]|uniref:peptidyl-tRNA hydrolase n=1 Tax=Hibiscus syriacus TaxID=106335 RepID=A0A6A2WHU2_HIBSY|nr:putative peptidyl-tRNA hydrolase PTRHD1 [Hibiscus syriacus]KAE8658663.1 putative peptidyl-tRNA hydrolase PTRHD1 [Hibiscus syriacus]